MSTDRIRAIREAAVAAADQIRHLLDSVPEETLTQRSTNGWTVAFTIGHLASFDAGFVRRIVSRVRAGKSVNDPEWIVNLVNRIQSFRQRRRSLAEVRAAFERDFPACLAVLDEITEADLDRRATMPVLGDTTLERFLHYTLAGHIAEHAPQIAVDTRRGDVVTGSA